MFILSAFPLQVRTPFNDRMLSFLSDFPALSLQASVTKPCAAACWLTCGKNPILTFQACLRLHNRISCYDYASLVTLPPQAPACSLLTAASLCATHPRSQRVKTSTPPSAACSRNPHASAAHVPVLSPEGPVALAGNWQAPSPSNSNHAHYSPGVFPIFEAQIINLSNVLR
jgi:hypothetical protein